MNLKSLKVKIIFSLAITIAVVFSVFPVLASDSASHKITVKIPVIQAMRIETVDSTSSGKKIVTKYDIPEPSDGDLSSGYLEEEDVAMLAVTSNVNWKVTVRSSGRYLGTSNDGTYKKPVTDLMVGSSGQYSQVTTTPKTIVEEDPGVFNLGLDYKVQYDKSEYKPGSYEATLVYTISSRA